MKQAKWSSYKWTYGFSGYNYRNTTLSKSYPIVSKIIMCIVLHVHNNENRFPLRTKTKFRKNSSLCNKQTFQADIKTWEKKHREQDWPTITDDFYNNKQTFQLGILLKKELHQVRFLDQIYGSVFICSRYNEILHCTVKN